MINIVPRSDASPGIARFFGMQNTIQLATNNDDQPVMMEIYEP